MRIMLLVSSFNGLTQRVWCALREEGHLVTVEFAVDPGGMVRAVEDFDPDLVLCPFLKERVPEAVWRSRRTVIVHPGPVGDRGPSSLDHAISSGARVWGVTALQAVEEMDAGPVWATRTFALPEDPARKSGVYGDLVADAAMACVSEVVAKAATPGYVPVPLARAHHPVPGTGLLPSLRQIDRSFGWDEPAERIVRRIRAADGSPGVLTSLAGVPVHAFDAVTDPPPGPAGRPAPARAAVPGTVLGHAEGAVLVAAGPEGREGVWVGHLKPRGGVKLPSTAVLRGALRKVPHLTGRHPAPWLTYRRHEGVGTLTFTPYNGALSTRQCRRLSRALRHALQQDTRALVLRGGFDAFGNGIHLNVIETAEDPAHEAWANIRAINTVCRQICATSRQVVLAAVTGNAGAGGAMMALGADVVVARSGVVLNPYYDMGIYGSELHTLSLPRRVGEDVAARLLEDKLPVDARQAHRLGMVDAVGPRDHHAFTGWVHDLAARLAGDASRRRAGADHPRRPLSYYETAELAEMSRDMFDDRNGFADQRKAFVHKTRPTSTPRKLALHRV